MKNPATEAPGSGPTITLEAHVAELRAAVDTRLDETAPPHRALRRYDEKRVDEIVERYLAGDSTVTISADLDIPIRTVGYQLERRGIERRPSSVPYKHPAPDERVCAREGCGEEFKPTGHQVANGGGKFCSRSCARAASRIADPEERTCARKGCGKAYTRMPSEAVRPGHGQFCSHRCRQLHFWRAEGGAQVESFVDSLKERGLWRKRAQQEWPGRWSGHKGAEHGHLGGVHGIENRKNGRNPGRPPKVTPDQGNEIWNLYGSGLSSREISDWTRSRRRPESRPDRSEA